MAPNLSYIDISKKELLEQVTPPHHQISLRHLAITQKNTVVLGAQYQGHSRDDQPLVFTHRRGQTLRPMVGQTHQERKELNQYIASVSVSKNGETAVTSSPKGDRISIWNIKSSKWVGDISVPDVGGVAPCKSNSLFVLSSGNGSIYQLNTEEQRVTKESQNTSVHWDNHLARL